MGFSGPVFGVVAVIWLIYLIPLFLHRRDNGLMDDIEPGEPFSASVTIVRKGSGVETAEAGVASVSTPLNRRAALRELADLDRAAARRRRRVLGFLALVTLTVVGFGIVDLLPWWSVAIPATLTAAFLVVARFSVRSMRQDLDARALLVRGGADADEPTISFAVTDEQLDLDVDLDAEHSVELSVPIETTGSLWDPIPITAPTYVSRPLAPRTVRTIDLSAPVPAQPVLPVTADHPDAAFGAAVARTDEPGVRDADHRRAVGE